MILLPSGDQEGPLANAPGALTACGLLPSRLTTPIAVEPTYASCCPSGDQAGSLPKTDETCRGLLPSASMTQRFQLPARVLPNAIFVPSGDQAGSESTTSESAGGEISVCPLPSAFMTQT